MSNENTTPQFSKSEILATIYEQCEERALTLLQEADKDHFESEDNFVDQVMEDLNNNPLDTYYYETYARGPIEVIFDAVVSDLYDVTGDAKELERLVGSAVLNGLGQTVNSLVNLLAIYTASGEASGVWNSHVEEMKLEANKSA